MTTNYTRGDDFELNEVTAKQETASERAAQRLFTTDKDSKAELMKQALANRLRQTTAVKK